MGHREIEENLWRAIRYGLDGEQIDFGAQKVIPAREALDRVVAWTEPARERLGIDVEVPADNGAIRARAAYEAGSTIADVYRDGVAQTRATYVREPVRR